MLKKLREKKNIKRIMFLTAILVIPAFIFWGVGSVLRQRAHVSLAGKVFSKKISKDYFLSQYKEVYSQALLLYGDNLGKVENYLNLEGQTWQRIILLAEAKKEGIRVTDKEVIDYVKKSPLFQKKGKFDKNAYETITKYYLGLTPREYEEEVRNNLKIHKLLNRVISEVKITEEEAWQEYKKEKNLYKFSYIIFKPSSYYPQVKYTPEELLNFYKGKKELFKKPEQVNLLYIKVSPVDFLNKVKVSQEEIQEYYQEHKQEFKKREETKKDTNVSSKEKGAKKEENKNLISKEAAQKIEKKLKEQKAKDAAENLAWEISDKLKSGATFEKVAAEYNLKTLDTGFFSPWDPIPGIGWAYKITQKAFNLKPGEISDVIEVENSFYIVKLKEKKAPYIPEFSEVKDKVEVRFKNEKAKELALKDAQEKLAQITKLLEEGKNLEDFLKSADISLKQTNYITRSKYIPGVGNAFSIIDNLKTFAPGKFNPEVIKAPGGFLIVRIDEIKPASKEDFEKEKKKFMGKLLARRKKKKLDDWFAQIKERADLEVYYRLPRQR